MQHNIYRSMIESVVEKGIRELGKRSKRELRNLVELGTRCAHGRFQNDFFKMARHMLADDNSPYYDMIFRLAKDTEPQFLSTFCINIGYNSWCIGAKKIRAYEQAHGHNVPWMILCDLENGDDKPLTQQELSRLILQGKQIGIYSYSFFLNSVTEDVEWLFELFLQHPDCAFLLFFDELTDQMIGTAGGCRNALLIRCINGENGSDLSRELFDNSKMGLSSIGIRYDETNMDAVMDWYTHSERIKKEQGTFLFLLRKRNCPEGIAQKMNAFANDCREAPKQPLFLMDFYEDIAYVDRVISTESCFLKVLRDGSLVTGNPFANADGNLRDGTLSELLQRYMPKVNYLAPPVKSLFFSVKTR